LCDEKRDFTSEQALTQNYDPIRTLRTKGFVDGFLCSQNGANELKASATLCFVEFVRWRHHVEDCILF